MRARRLRPLIVPAVVIAAALGVWLTVLLTMQPQAPADPCGGHSTPAPTTVPGPAVVSR